MSDDHGGGGGEPLAEINIHDLIRDRKMERKLKAEQKREMDLQRIKDKWPRPTTGIDPLQLFPKEIWTMIFKKLDPEDRGNVWEVHPVFREMMEGTRVRDILFPQLLKVKEFLNQSEFHQELRLVSQSVKKSADTTYVNMIILGFDFSGIRKLKRLLKYLAEDESVRLSLFQRTLIVNTTGESSDNDNDDDGIWSRFRQFENDIITLLKIIGDQIWSFSFSFDFRKVEDLDFDLCDVQNVLHMWISLMPNLRRLNLSIIPSTQMEEAQGISVLKNCPFPRLVHLEILHLYPGLRGGFNDLYEIVIQANQHIKILEVHECFEAKTSDPPLVPVHLTQSLLLNGFGVGNDASLQRIQSVVNYNWPLQTITLSLHEKRERDNTLVAVFPFLKQFPTLERVELEELLEFGIAHTDMIGYLNLPNLKDFVLNLTQPTIDYESNVHFFFSLQFLVKCKKLKKLSWIMSGFEFDYKELRNHLMKYENGKTTDFRAGLRNLYSSNIWDVFPYLDAVDVKFWKDEFHDDEDDFDEDEDGGTGGICQHVFRRAEIENMSIAKLLKSHSCTRETNRISSCCGMFAI